jgi:hypothetical protein
MIIQGRNTILYDCLSNISLIFHGYTCDKDNNIEIITLYLLFKINKLNIKYGCVVFKFFFDIRILIARLVSSNFSLELSIEYKNKETLNSEIST